MSLRILIIDDDDIITDLLVEICSRLEHQAVAINDPQEIKTSLTDDFDLIFLDLNMPIMDGIEVMRFLARKQISSSLVLMSGFDESVLLTAMELAETHGLNTTCKLNKPFQANEVIRILQTINTETPSPVIKPKTPQKLISEKEIRQALDQKRVVVHYQPQLDLSSHCFVGMEALCRLKTKSGDIIMPDEFIPVAEKTDMIHDLTVEVVQIIANDFEKFFFQHPHLTVSINVSTQDLDYLVFPDQLHQMFVDRNIPTSRIIIEVTETMLIRDLNKGLDVLARMRLKGFKVSIDDFGQGAATIAQVKHFPVTEIKVDKEFILEILTSKKSEVIVAQTISMAHRLGIDVVAEGVESKEVEAWLSDKGCDIVQGYLYSEPVSLNKIEELLSAQENHIELDTTFDEQEDYDSPAEPQPDIEASKTKLMVSSILPLSGTYSFIGNSFLYGVKAAFHQFNLEDPSVHLELESFDDHSDIETFERLYKNNLSDNSIAALGAVFTLSNRNRFIETLKQGSKPLIGPYSGSRYLRSPELTNIINIRPSYEDEIKTLVDHIQANGSSLILVYPESAFGNKIKNTVLSHTKKVIPVGFKSDQRSVHKLVSEIKTIQSKDVIYVGSAKLMGGLVKALDDPMYNFHTISLVGLGSVMQSLKHYSNHLYVSSPIEDYLGTSESARNFRTQLSSLLTSDNQKYMNIIAYEGYIVAQAFITAMRKADFDPKANLTNVFKSFEGVNIGVAAPLTWEAEKRQLLHEVYILKG